MTNKINMIKALLEGTEGISDFRINVTKTESKELFFVHRSLETVRATDTADIKVTVFVEHDGKLGDATFTVYTSYDEAKIKSEIERAKKKAELIDNEMYPLPENEQGAHDFETNFVLYDVNELASEISDAVFSADSYENGSINALEIFIYYDTVRVINSRGIDKIQQKCRAMIEAIPTWNTANESVELYECCNFTEFSREAVHNEIDRKMHQVRDRMIAQKPKEKLSCAVVLEAPELAELFESLAYELNYSRIYSHSNAFSIGDAIQKDPVGDKLTVKMCGQVKGSIHTSAFDSDGFTFRDTEIIKDGIATGAYGSVRYAFYLGGEATGALRCMHVVCGSMSDDELRAQPYFKCVSMSGLQVDIYSDYIGGEVRLAYYFDGEKEIPLTGISISGRLSDALSSMRLSNTETRYENYEGPRFACLSNIEIV